MFANWFSGPTTNWRSTPLPPGSRFDPAENGNALPEMGISTTPLCTSDTLPRQHPKPANHFVCQTDILANLRRVYEVNLVVRRRNECNRPVADQKNSAYVGLRERLE